jgi:hypothetical protein
MIFWGMRSKEKLYLTFKHVHSHKNHMIWSKELKIMASKGMGPLAKKKKI